MEEFRVIQPAPALAHYVKNYWLLKTAMGSEGGGECEGQAAAVARTVPTGMMNLIFHRGRRLLSVHENALHPRAFLSGQERTFADLRVCWDSPTAGISDPERAIFLPGEGGVGVPTASKPDKKSAGTETGSPRGGDSKQALRYDGQVDMISVVFRPAGVRAFFNLPLGLARGLRLTAGDLEDRELGALEASLTSTEDDRMCILLIEQFLFRRLMRLAEHNLKRIETTIQLINFGEANVGALADAACLSNKQFDRVFTEYVGAHPKEFSRTIRFQRALHKLETDPGIGWATLAADCGYFDQSHMIRDFRALSGYTPGEYVAACPPHSDYF